MFNRRDLRTLPDGWYEFIVKTVEEVVNAYGPGVKVTFSVAGGPQCGSAVVWYADRVATPRNKSGRFLGALGFDASVELPIVYGDIVGRRCGGRVQRYTRDGRVRAKVVEFCPVEKVRELLESRVSVG